MGSGRVIDQDFTRINKAINDGSFAALPALQNTLAELGSNRIHVLGLYSPGGVHSHEQQIDFLVNHLLAATSNVSVHCFLDGRDTPPISARDSLLRLETLLSESNSTGIASISGRYYAMDRDQRWDRTKLVFDMLTDSSLGGRSDLNAIEALENSYSQNETDEFVQPTKTKHFVPIQDNDVVIFMNFRADRARQLTGALVFDDFHGFDRQNHPKISQFITLTSYSGDINETQHSIPVHTLFPVPTIRNSLGEYFAEVGMRQLRVAESEKFAHVTYFFSGGREQCFVNETRKIIASPSVATYDLKPEMSAESVTDAVISAIESRHFDAVVCNFANGDMVGHTGDFDASVQAVECLDRCLGRIFSTIKSNTAQCFVTADHGNVEHLFDADSGQANTAHTNNPVPFLYVGPHSLKFRTKGALADIAPTILEVLGLPIPNQMTGKSLLIN